MDLGVLRGSFLLYLSVEAIIETPRLLKLAEHSPTQNTTTFVATAAVRAKVVDTSESEPPHDIQLIEVLPRLHDGCCLLDLTSRQPRTQITAHVSLNPCVEWCTGF